jgi:hypothetical protein
LLVLASGAVARGAVGQVIDYVIYHTPVHLLAERTVALVNARQRLRDTADAPARRKQTSALRQHTSAYVRIRQCPSAPAGHSSAYLTPARRKAVMSDGYERHVPRSMRTHI